MEHAGPRPPPTHRCLRCWSAPTHGRGPHVPDLLAGALLRASANSRYRVGATADVCTPSVPGGLIQEYSSALFAISEMASVTVWTGHGGASPSISENQLRTGRFMANDAMNRDAAGTIPKTKIITPSMSVAPADMIANPTRCMTAPIVKARCRVSVRTHW